MGIYLRRSPDPFSERSWDEEPRPILAESDAYRQLRGELERYVTGELNGSSYLISGHRGSGKTTLVLKAIQDVRLDLEREGIRPLLIRLSGPDLLSDPPRAKETAPEPDEPSGEGQPDSEAFGEKDAREEASKQTDSRSPRAEAALKRITLAIYRSLCRQITWSLSRREGGLEDRLSPQTQREMAAELQLLLDSAPGPGELREYWLRLGCLESGLLFHPSYARRGQGHRELVATASAAQAYQKLIGKLTKSEKKTSEAKRDSSAAFTGESKGTELIQAVSTLVAASAVGAGVAFEQLLAGLAAAAVALFGGWGVNFDLTRAWNRSRSDDYSFILDTSLATLERELPILVERLRAAGLAPIFVVDELDKVNDLTGSMEVVVNHLKQFVSEGAFFCFLTDRDYFETLRRRLGRDPYPPEYTYFRDQILISYRPDDLRKYLKEVLQIDTPTDEADREILINILLHRASLHVIDLRRELRRMTRVPKDTQQFDLEPGKVRSELGSLLEAAMQIAIEVVFAEDEVQLRLEADPGFAQLMVDALYFPSRNWRNGETELDLSEDSFRKYLSDRMQPNERTGADSSDAAENCYLTDPDVKELHGLARRVVFLLVNFRRLTSLKSRPAGWSKSYDDLLDSLIKRLTEYFRGNYQPGVLSPRVAGSGIEASRRTTERKIAPPARYHWLCDCFGRSVAADKTNPRRHRGGFPAYKEEAESAKAEIDVTDREEQTVAENSPSTESKQVTSARGMGCEEAGDGQLEEPQGAVMPGSKQAPRDEVQVSAPLSFLDEKFRNALLEGELPLERFSNWSKLRKILLDLNGAIFDLTDLFDLESLGTELGLLSTTPSWLQVKDALDRLALADQEPRFGIFFEEDVHLVTSYLRMLTLRLPCVYVSYHLALSALGGLSTEKQLTLGSSLKALVDLLELSKLERSGNSDMKLLQKMVESSGDWIKNPPRFSLNLDSQAWKSLPKFVADPDLPLKEMADTLWTVWDQRLKRFLRLRQENIEPSFLDLVSRVRSLPPGQLLSTHLKGLGLHVWGRLLNSALEQEELGHPPPWFVFSAARSLEIPLQFLRSILPSIESPSEYFGSLDTAKFHHWRKWAASLGSERLRGCALLLYAGEPELTENWLVPHGFSCLPINLQTVRDLSLILAFGSFGRTPIVILWEENAERSLGLGTKEHIPLADPTGMRSVSLVRELEEYRAFPRVVVRPDDSSTKIIERAVLKLEDVRS